MCNIGAMLCINMYCINLFIFLSFYFNAVVLKLHDFVFWVILGERLALYLEDTRFDT
jgi:hypothetical protein